MNRDGALTALGLMSGTSLDGIDAALVTTDGVGIEAFGPAVTVAYPEPFRARVRGVLGREDDGDDVRAVARELTERHAEAVKQLLARTGGRADVIGFHGQTLLHRPAFRMTRQIGDGALLARLTGIPVVNDFRAADVAAGGQGAPFAPLFHAAMTGAMERPLAVLNVGGVANVTWIGSNGRLVAFDTGPGNALIDDWARRHAGLTMDEGGRLARGGRVDRGRLAALLAHSYFGRPPPKSLDRDDFTFTAAAGEGLSIADGSATLTRFTAEAVARALGHLPAVPARWIVTGGGRHNATLMAALGGCLGAPVEAAESVGWQGDALEAQAFAFLAVRSLKGLPLSLPETTGVPRPMPGGTLHRPA